VALAEACFGRGLGADIDYAIGLRPDIALFSESQSRILLSAAPDKADALAERLAAHGVPVQRLGTVGGTRLRVAVNGRAAIDAEVDELRQIWRDAIPCRMR
jgi:phosphoribosylformylglycinamidine synthase